jgi:regulator of protease activity HflC (stomatin/prohibitin superfamily)
MAIKYGERFKDPKTGRALTEAQAIQLVSQALGSAGSPAQYLIAQKYLEALGQISTNAQKLVFLPYEASGIMASLGGIKELLQAK